MPEENVSDIARLLKVYMISYNLVFCIYEQTLEILFISYCYIMDFMFLGLVEICFRRLMF